MLLLAGRLVCILLAILLLALVVSPAVLLDQLHSGVIFGGLLEFLNSLCALLLVLSKPGAEGFDTKAVVRSEGRARYINEYRTACKAAPFESTEVVISDDKKKDDRINEISEAEIKCPNDAGAARACAEVVEGGLSISDLSRKRRKRFFEGGGVGGFALACTC
jgi:hypothetical protein